MLLVMYRRSGRARKVRVDRVRVLPLVVLGTTAWAVLAPGMPPVSWLALYALAAATGAAVGYFRSRYTQLSFNAETGDVESRQTPVATAILMGLFAAKVGIGAMFGGKPPKMSELFIPDAVDAIHAAQHASPLASAVDGAANALLIFSMLVYVAGTAETWFRARRLVDERRRDEAMEMAEQKSQHGETKNRP